MAKQLQLRRGNTSDNTVFTGANGELTLDTSTKQIIVHDGVTQGGCGFVDTVVGFQAPTAANNYTWYRKYASGWVEQGGVVSVAQFALGSGSTTTVGTITFPVEVTKITGLSFGDDMTFFNLHARDKTGTGMTIKASNQLGVSYTQNACEIFWEVKGMAHG